MKYLLREVRIFVGVHRMGDLQKTAALELVLGIAQHLAAGFVHLEQRTIRTHDGHAERYFFKNLTETLLACAQCLLSLFALGDVAKHN